MYAYNRGQFYLWSKPEYYEKTTYLSGLSTLSKVGGYFEKVGGEQRCRSTLPVTDPVKAKISLFCHVQPQQVSDQLWELVKTYISLSCMYTTKTGYRELVKTNIIFNLYK
jgi:hypothetical protein